MKQAYRARQPVAKNFPTRARLPLRAASLDFEPQEDEREPRSLHSLKPASLPVAKTSILYQEAFQEVADAQDLVIGIREPNPLGAQLLEEGYASKGFHIKAKSSVAGPTAGLVATAPEFGKLGAAGAEKQRRYIEYAFSQRARQVPLRLSDARREQLIALGLMQFTGKDSVSADYGDAVYNFTLTRDDDGSGLPWTVFRDDGEVVNILANPERSGGPDGPRAAVTADYDLFGLYPRPNRSGNVRPLNPVARLVGPHVSAIAETAKSYLDRHRSTGQKEAPDLGNMHFYGQTIKNALNRALALDGRYKGGLLVHHNDESGNPYSPGQDFPLRFIVPGSDAILVEDNDQLLQAYEWFRKLGYSVEINPAFSFRSF